MANNKKNAKKTQQAVGTVSAGKTSARRSAPRRMGGALDSAAMAWARLLQDPCYAPVAHPVYPGAEGGLLARFEAEQTFATGATETGVVLGFIPGGLVNAVYVNGTALTSDTTTTLLGVSTGASPGLAFLQSSASAVRCVSACMQVSWPGSELNRQGQVTLGQCTGSIITQALTSATSISQLRPLCHLRARVPDTMLEVKWRPTLGDANWNDPSSTNPPGDLAKKGALLATVSNLPVSTGIRVRFVVTYEWQPRTNQGLASAYDSTASSKFSQDDVINFLDKNGPGWAYTASTAAGVAMNMRDAYNAARVAGRGARVIRNY